MAVIKLYHSPSQPGLESVKTGTRPAVRVWWRLCAIKRVAVPALASVVLELLLIFSLLLNLTSAPAASFGLTRTAARKRPLGARHAVVARTVIDESDALPGSAMPESPLEALPCSLPAPGEAPATQEEGEQAIQCLVDYVRDEFGLALAPGVSARYGGTDPQNRRGFNHATGDRDDVVEIFEQAFTNAQHSEDVLGVVYEELWHSRQEDYVETHAEWHKGLGNKVWNAPAPCGASDDVCQEIEASYGSLAYQTSYGPALEIQAKSAVLELKVVFSQEYVNHLQMHLAEYLRVVDFAPGFFTNPRNLMGPENWIHTR